MLRSVFVSVSSDVRRARSTSFQESQRLSRTPASEPDESGGCYGCRPDLLAGGTVWCRAKHLVFLIAQAQRRSNPSRLKHSFDVGDGNDLQQGKTSS
jgi:hypothetical protein